MSLISGFGHPVHGLPVVRVRDGCFGFGESRYSSRNRDFRDREVENPRRSLAVRLGVIRRAVRASVGVGACTKMGCPSQVPDR